MDKGNNFYYNFNFAIRILKVQRKCNIYLLKYTI